MEPRKNKIKNCLFNIILYMYICLYAGAKEC